MSTLSRRAGAHTAAARKKSSYHHGELRKALIAATLKLIPAMGVRELSLRAVARCAGVSHSASYRHFSSKESLLAAIAEQGFAMLTDAMSSAIEAHPGNSLAKLQAAGAGYVRFGLEHPHHLQIMFGGAIGRFEDYPMLVAAAKAARQQLTSIVNQGLVAGALRTANEQLVQVAAWAIVHGLAVLMASGQVRTVAGGDLSQAEKAAIADGVTKLFCDGLAPCDTPTKR